MPEITGAEFADCDAGPVIPSAVFAGPELTPTEPHADTVNARIAPKTQRRKRTNASEPE